MYSLIINNFCSCCRLIDLNCERHIVENNSLSRTMLAFVLRRTADTLYTRGMHHEKCKYDGNAMEYWHFHMVPSLQRHKS